MNYELLKDKVDFNAIAVDAGCSGNPGAMEYQGVYLGSPALPATEERKLIVLRRKLPELYQQYINSKKN